MDRPEQAPEPEEQKGEKVPFSVFAKVVEGVAFEQATEDEIRDLSYALLDIVLGPRASTYVATIAKEQVRRCPFCGTADPCDVDPDNAVYGTAHSTFTCKKCFASWYEVWNITDIVEITKPDDNGNNIDIPRDGKFGGLCARPDGPDEETEQLVHEEIAMTEAQAEEDDFNLEEAFGGPPDSRD